MIPCSEQTCVSSTCRNISLQRKAGKINLCLDPKGLTCASLCWLSASPGEISACLASWISSAEPSITLRAESSMAAAALGSVVEAATPRAACARVLRAWAVSLAAIPAAQGQERGPLIHIYLNNYSSKVCHTHAALIFLLKMLQRSYRHPNMGSYHFKKGLKMHPRSNMLVGSLIWWWFIC